MKKALLIVNTGTPDSPDHKDVRKYLSEFLNDPMVIDLPWLIRKILVNLIIIPFRTPRSAALYRRIWTAEGAPLKINLENLVTELKTREDEGYIIKGAMRYGQPSLREVLNELKREAVGQITILPLYPQYATSTTGSVRRLLEDEVSKWTKAPVIRFIDQYHNNPSFIDSFSKTIIKYDPHKFDHIVFSYHGLPIRHITKLHPSIKVESCECHEKMPPHGGLCYRAACYETSRLLASRLGLEKTSFSTSFQSRLSDKWLSPFTDKTLINLAKSGKKRVLVAAPSFTADCLETLSEIGIEYKELFIKAGGEELVPVESLNSDINWVNAITRIAEI